jgi:hypothetical protein
MGYGPLNQALIIYTEINAACTDPAKSDKKTVAKHLAASETEPTYHSAVLL